MFLTYNNFHFPNRPQEGHLMEMEATGAPQKHHHALNQ